MTNPTGPLRIGGLTREEWAQWYVMSLVDGVDYSDGDFDVFLAAAFSGERRGTDADDLSEATKIVDWQQVVLNGGPPCFSMKADAGRFCLRAKRWEGHDSHHAYVSLAALLRSLAPSSTEKP